MRKSGFTLIEMLVTILLVAAIGILVSTNMVNMLGRQGEKEFTSFKEKLESAACVYGSMPSYNNSGSVDIKTLITAGYIDESLKDPRTGEEVDKTIKITIKYVNQERICELVE